MTPPNLQALQAQLTALGETMQQSLQRVETNIADINSRLRGLENREAGCQPLINQRLDASWRVIDELRSDIATMKKAAEIDKSETVERLKELEIRLGMVIWVGGIAGTAIILWLMNNWLGFIR